VGVRPARGGRKRLDDVRRRANLGVAAAEVDERRPLAACGGRDLGEQGGEVLLGQPVEPLGPRSHACDRTGVRAVLGVDIPLAEADEAVARFVESFPDGWHRLTAAADQSSRSRRRELSPYAELPGPGAS
jgi:hypothetical protein